VAGGLAALARTFVLVEVLFRRQRVRLLSLLAIGVAAASAVLLAHDFLSSLLAATGHHGPDAEPTPAVGDRTGAETL